MTRRRRKPLSRSSTAAGGRLVPQAADRGHLGPRRGADPCAAPTCPVAHAPQLRTPPHRARLRSSAAAAAQLPVSRAARGCAPAESRRLRRRGAAAAVAETCLRRKNAAAVPAAPHVLASTLAVSCDVGAALLAGWAAAPRWLARVAIKAGCVARCGPPACWRCSAAAPATATAPATARAPPAATAARTAAVRAPLMVSRPAGPAMAAPLRCRCIFRRARACCTRRALASLC